MYKEECGPANEINALRKDVREFCGAKAALETGEEALLDVSKAIKEIFGLFRENCLNPEQYESQIVRIKQFSSSSNFTLLDEFLQPNLITIFINLLKIECLPLIFDVVAIMTDIWFENDDPSKSFYYDEELIDQMIALFANIPETQQCITKAFTNCVLTSIEAASYISCQAQFIELFFTHFDYSNISFLVSSMKLLIAFLSQKIYLPFRTLFAKCSSLLLDSIPFVSQCANYAVFMYLQVDFPFAIDANPNLISNIINGMKLGYTNSLKYGLTSLTLIVHYCINHENAAKCEINGQYNGTQNHAPVITYDLIQLQHNNDLNTAIISALRKFTQDDGGFIYDFISQSCPILAEDFWNSNIIQHIFESFDYISFINKEHATACLCDFYSQCHNEELKMEIAPILFPYILEILSTNEKPQVLFYLNIIQTMIIRETAFDSDELLRVLEELAEGSDESISFLAQTMLTNLFGESE